jgi:hypothetical protein
MIAGNENDHGANHNRCNPPAQIIIFNGTEAITRHLRALPAQQPHPA